MGDVIKEKDATGKLFEPTIAHANNRAEEHPIEMQGHVAVGCPLNEIVDRIEERQYDPSVIGFTGHSAVYERIME